MPIATVLPSKEWSSLPCCSGSADEPNRTVPPSIRASIRFIDGEPMNAATNRLAGSQ